MAQLREHEAIRSKSDAFRADPRLLNVEPGFNVRDLDAPMAREGLDELKADIRENGVQVALEVRLVDETLFITSGHRRHKVVMELIEEGVEIETVPVIAEPKRISDAERVARLFTLNSGEPLTALEKAEVVRRLVAYGWTRDRIAQRIGVKTLSVVDRYQDLSAAPEEVRAAVRTGEISATNAVAIVRKEGPLLAKEKLEIARETAQSRGKARITAKSISPAAPKPKGVPAQQTIEVLVATLREIAVSGDGPKDQIQARMCLKLQGFAVPEVHPEDEDSEAA